MAIRAFKPTSAGRRFYTVSDFSEITTDVPQRKLLEPKPSTGGRNHYGRITSRFRGGGHKQQYRVIDFRRDKIGVPAKVAEIEYDPNRSARIALLHYADGDKRYILAPDGLREQWRRHVATGVDGPDPSLPNQHHGAEAEDESEEIEPTD